MKLTTFIGHGVCSVVAFLMVSWFGFGRAAAWQIVSVETGGHLHAVTVIFSTPVDSQKATRIEHYSISPAVVLTNVLALSSTTVRLMTTRIDEGRVYLLEIAGVTDRAGSLAEPPATATITFLQTQGAITLKAYQSIDGWQVADLLGHPGFPSDPDVVLWRDNLEAPTDQGERFGMMFQGFVTAPESGDYRFYLCSDDQGSLLLSSTDNPADKRLIATEPEWAGPREWLAFANQNSRVPPPIVDGAFVIDGEDFDFDGGRFLPESSAMPYRGGAYVGAFGSPDVDYHDGDTEESVEYRPPMAGVVIEPSQDRRRSEGSVEVDYVLAHLRAGDWYNYTRELPAGEYFVLARTCGVGLPMRARLDEVVAGAGTREQRLRPLGRFDAPFTGAWDRFELVPLRDDTGALVTMTGGGRRTLRFTVEPGALNFNYLLLLSTNEVSSDLDLLRPRNRSVPIRLFQQLAISVRRFSGGRRP